MMSSSTPDGVKYQVEVDRGMWEQVYDGRANRSDAIVDEG